MGARAIPAKSREASSGPLSGGRRSVPDVKPAGDFVQRLEKLENERSIRQLLDLHWFLCDAGPAEAFAELFTEDCVVDLGRLVSPDKITIVEGHSDLMERYLDPGHTKWEGRSQHLSGGPQAIHVAGDAANAVDYAVTTLLFDGVPKTIVVGFNFWQLRQTSGRWRISRRVARRLGDEDIRKLFRPFVEQVIKELDNP
jgi:SnoaL-like domain